MTNLLCTSLKLVNIVYSRKSSPKILSGIQLFKQIRPGFPLRSDAGMTDLEKSPFEAMASLSKVYNQDDELYENGLGTVRREGI